ncbi:MAG: hypothetical protein RI907_2174 [Pseudomonadota bacterium]|jgi:uncharacterized surface protein with fasciclin (FAS1) repeats
MSNPLSTRLKMSAAALGVSLILTAPLSAKASSISLQGLVKCATTQLAVVDGTIVDAAVATPELSTLVSLVKAAGLVDALSGPGPLTVYAPTNDAFGKVPAPLLGLIGGDSALLTSVLTYHVSPGTVDPRRNVSPMKVKTLNGQTVFVGATGQGATINQSTTSCKGVKTRNGTVWLVDSVLLPQFR